MAVGHEHAVVAGGHARHGGGLVAGVERHHVGAIVAGDLVRHHIVGRLEFLRAVRDLLIALDTQRGGLLADRDEVLDVLGVVTVVGVVHTVPIHGVDRITGLVAVLVAALGAQELLAHLELGDAERHEDGGVGELRGLDDLRLLPGFVEAFVAALHKQRLLELVVERQVVVDLHIVDHLAGIRVLDNSVLAVVSTVAVGAERAFGRAVEVAAAEHVVHDERFHTLLARDEPVVLIGEHRALEAVADRIVEERNGGVRGVELVAIGLNRHRGLVHRGVHVPTFADDDDRRVDLVEGRAHLLHRLHIMQAHEVETEAVHVVFLRPVGHGIHDVLAHHRTLGGGVVAAARVVDERAVLVAEVVPRHREPERVRRGIGNMVVHHVHDHTQAVGMQAVHHLLGLDHAVGGVGRVRGVGAFRHIVVERIVTPVVVGVIERLRLVDARVVEHRLDLHMRDAELLEVVHAGGLARGVRGAVLDHAQVLAALCGVHTGVLVLREVADVRLRDHRVGVLGERRHATRVLDRRLGRRQHHGTLAVDHGCAGVRVGGVVDGAIGERHAVDVGGAVGDLGRGAPHTLLTAVHRDGVGGFGVGGLGVLERHELDLACGRGPELEGRAVIRPGRAKVVAVVGVFLVEGVSAHHGARDGVGRTEALDFDRVLRGQVEVVLQRDRHGGAIGLHRVDVDGIVLGVGHLHILNLDIGRLRQLRVDRVVLRDLGRRDAGAERRARGVDGRVVLHEPDFCLGGAVIAEDEGIGGHLDVTVGAVLLFPFVHTVAAQQTEVRFAVGCLIGVVRERCGGELTPVIMARELRGEAIAVRVPHPQIPLRDLRLGVVGVEVQAVVAHVMHGHVDLVGLALVVVGRFQLGLTRRVHAVDPHFHSAVLLGELDVTVAVLGIVADRDPLGPVLSGDDEAEVGELLVERQFGHLAIAVLTGELVACAVKAVAGLGRAPRPQRIVRIARGLLVVDDHTGLAADRLGVAHRQRAVLDRDMRDALADQIVLAAVAVPLAGTIIEADLVILTLGVDRLRVVALRVRSFHLFAGNGCPIRASAMVHEDLVPRVDGLVPHGRRLVVRLDGVVRDDDVRGARVNGHVRHGVRRLRCTAVDRDGLHRRHGHLDLAAGDGHGLRAVLHSVDVAVLAVGHRGRVFGRLVFGRVVDRDKALVATRERDVIRAVVLPLLDGGPVHVVVERDHAARRRPTLLAVPFAVLRRARLVEVHVRHFGRDRTRGAVVVDVVLIVRQQARRAVVIGEHECVRERVHRIVLVRDRTVVASGVPVRHEDVRVLGRNRVRIRRQVADARREVLEFGDLALELRVEVRLVVELRHGAGLQVIARLDAGRFARIADDFLDPVDVVGVLADLLGHLVFDALDVLVVDVLDGIHAEALDAHLVELGEIVGLDVLHLLARRVEVPHRVQAAFLHLLLVLVIGDACAVVVVMEVGGGHTLRILAVFAGEARIVAGQAVVLRARHTGLLACSDIQTGRLVEHDVGDDADARGITGGDHVLEFGFGAELRIEFVAHRLVACPPFGALDRFLWR